MVDNTPRVLAGRYEVGELIGRGGMAEVHIGHDTRLGRTVAIKILRSDLARDPSFLARFRREAQAAASLNHPAVVAVYDTGEDTFTDPVSGQQITIPFIVMEYVEGHTVREILTHGTAVPIDEAVEITAGVLSALEYSHHAGIIHRDIKPANVMITPTGAVKVMDFGIARAVADSAATMTQTQAVIGTAQYLSPEQARGETVDARSDIYSTGCLLFELLTGRPPFVGDSPVAVAYQHVGQAPAKPSELASDVPPDLDRITLKALTKERDARYSSAAEFRTDLERFLAGQEPLAGTGAMAAGISDTGTGPIVPAFPVPAPSPTASATARPTGGEATGPQPTVPFRPLPGQRADATLAMPGVDPNATQVLRSGAAAPGYPGAGNATELISPATLNAPGSVPPTRAIQQAPAWAPVAPATQPPPRPMPTAVAEPPRRSKAWLGVLIPLLVVGLGFLGWNLLRGGGLGFGAGSVEVPAVAHGMTRDQARELIEAANLRFTDLIAPDADAPEGTFVSQDPAAGESVAAGSLVTVYFAGAPQTFSMPDVRNLTQGEAWDVLEQAGLTRGSVEFENDGTIATNRIIRTVPSVGDPVQRGQSVNLFVSNGMVDLPDLRGMTRSDALAELNRLGLTANQQDVEDATAAPQTVVAQTPGAGQVEQGTVVNLSIAIAPAIQQVPVPGVVGMPWNPTTQQLFTSLGLQYNVVEEYSSTIASGIIISTTPSGGTQANQGTTVTIVISRGPQQQVPPPVMPTDPLDPGWGQGQSEQLGPDD